MSIAYTIADIIGMLGIPVDISSGEKQVSGVSTDSRTVQPGDLFFALSGEKFDGDRFVDAAFAAGAAAAVTHRPHATGTCLIHPNPLEALQTLAARHRDRCHARVIAITGSCGKTTSKDMAAALLGARYPTVKTLGNLNNDIGCPLSLLRVGPDTRFAIIEMGANHSGEIAALCRIARPEESAVTMVAPAHLEGFGSVERVAAAKSEILEALPADGCFYVNTDDPLCVKMSARHPGRKVLFGSQGDVRLQSLHFDNDGEMVLSISPVGRIRLPLAIRAHATNVLLAVAIGLQHGVDEFEGPLREACKTASRFRVVRISPWTFLDDTYNANPASMKAALEALADYPGNRKIALLGSMFELGDAAAALHAEIGAAAARLGINWLWAIGPHAGDMVAGARAEGIGDAEVFDTHEAMAAAVRARAAGDDVVLLKGSRGMKMETVLQLLQTSAASQT